METSYAQALWQMIQRGTSPKKAVDALHESLLVRGREALMPRIGKAFARIAARDNEQNGITLSIAHAGDERKARQAAKEILSEIKASADDVNVKVDDSLIGGWRLEGREMLVDASWKKHLIDIYGKVTNTQYPDASVGAPTQQASGYNRATQ
jgi:F0F1-type ATP synthase delta subunit